MQSDFSAKPGIADGVHKYVIPEAHRVDGAIDQTERCGEIATGEVISIAEAAGEEGVDRVRRTLDLQKSAKRIAI